MKGGRIELYTDFLQPQNNWTRLGRRCNGGLVGGLYLETGITRRWTSGKY